MKKVRIRLLAFILFLMCTLTSCGDSVIALTPEEEDQIAFYAADIISKFNKRQNLGIVPVVMEPIVSEEPEPENPEEEDPQSPTGGGGASSEASQGNAGSLTDVVGIPGVTFQCRDIRVIESFVTDGYAVVPSGHNMYVCLTVSATNTTSAPMELDIASRSLSFSASLNGERTPIERTVIENDFTTYRETLGANSAVDLVMLFEFSAEAVSDLTDLSIVVTKEGIRRQVIL